MESISEPEQSKIKAVHMINKLEAAENVQVDHAEDLLSDWHMHSAERDDLELPDGEHEKIQERKEMDSSGKKDLSLKRDWLS